MSMWRDDALCRAANPALFFDDAHINEALAWCHACPVTEQCLKDALSRNDEGVAGGLTATERRRLRRIDINESLWVADGAVRVDITATQRDTSPTRKGTFT